MARRKKKKGYFGIGILVVSSIAFLNLVGISYAQWNDQLELFTTLSTGEMNLQFANGEKTFSFDKAVEKKGEISIPYTIIDGSSIPIELTGFDIEENKDISISVNNEDPKLNKSTNEPSTYDYDLKLNVNTSKPGKYDYKVEITYKQKEN